MHFGCVFCVSKQKRRKAAAALEQLSGEPVYDMIATALEDRAAKRHGWAARETDWVRLNFE
jgi:hypothetical protein